MPNLTARQVARPQRKSLVDTNPRHIAADCEKTAEPLAVFGSSQHADSAFRHPDNDVEITVLLADRGQDAAGDFSEADPGAVRAGRGRTDRDLVAVLEEDAAAAVGELDRALAVPGVFDQ